MFWIISPVIVPAIAIPPGIPVRKEITVVFLTVAVICFCATFFLSFKEISKCPLIISDSVTLNTFAKYSDLLTCAIGFSTTIF